MFNSYNAAMGHCKDEEIFFLIDGDDAYAGVFTFKVFNHFYQTRNAWFIYANYLHTVNG